MEPWQLITGVSVLLGIGGTAAGIWGTLRRERKADRDETRGETANLTVITVKLDQICTMIVEMKTELRNHREEMQDIRERLAIVEQKASSAHHRIDAATRKEG